MPSPSVTRVADCPKCRRAIAGSQSESWCVACGSPLGEEITSLLPKVVAQRTAVAREVAQGSAELTVSRGERIFRGMLGMGMTFGAVAFAIVAPMAVMAYLSGVDRDDLDFLIVAPFGWATIAFGMGALYAGLLALLARGRSFREVSVARVALAGAVIGLIPGAVVFVSGLITGGIRDAVEPLMIFPPMSAVVAAATLLIARRAKPQVGEGGSGPRALSGD